MIEEFKDENLCYFNGDYENDTVLKYLEDNRIFKLFKNDHGLVAVEACDNYFAAELSRDQIEKLIQELTELIND